MYYYTKEGNYAFSFDREVRFEEADEAEIKEGLEKDSSKKLYYLHRTDAGKRVSYAITDPEMIFEDGDDIEIIRKKEGMSERAAELPQWIRDMISQGRVQYLNIAHPLRKLFLEKPLDRKWRVNIAGLGDVGSNLLIGLKLLGGDVISEIGIFSNRENVVKRYEMEMN